MINKKQFLSYSKNNSITITVLFYLSSNFKNGLKIFCTTCWNILQFLNKFIYIEIVKTKLEQIFRKTFWNITKGYNNNRDVNKLIITIHYLYVSDKWCIIVQLFVNLYINVYVCEAAYFNNCTYFFILIPYNNTWFVVQYFYCCLYWNIPPRLCYSLYKHIQGPFDVWIYHLDFLSKS